MKRLLTFFTLVTLLLTPQLGFSAQSNVAKVIILRGAVKAKIGKKVIDLKKGMWLKEGALIQTAPRSFCKLIFIDKSQMSLGPKSQMQIKTFPKNKAGIINLLKGQLRSKVTKDYMKMDQNKSKLFIKTKTAAMGVRGTDFQVNFNPSNLVTSLVTFEGAVAMARIDERMENINQVALERAVSGRDAVIVTKGQYSGVDHASPRATPPTKINPAQLETLKKSTNSLRQIDTSSTRTKAGAKQFRNPIPPGVNSKTFANKASVETKIAAVVGKKVVEVVKKEIAKQERPEAAWAKKAAAQNSTEGSNTPKAGGFIDLKTALYIPPPKGSSFDSNTNTYIIPPTLGTVDQKTGEYLPPEGKVLTDDGRLIANVNYIPSTQVHGRDPASVGDVPPPPPGEPAATDAPALVVAPPPSDIIAEPVDPAYTLDGNEPIFSQPAGEILEDVAETFENGERVVLPEGYGLIHFHINSN